MSNEYIEKMVKLAKADVVSLTKRDWMHALDDLAKSMRKPKETHEQSFARALKTLEGGTLYQAYRKAKDEPPARPAPQPSLSDQSPSWREIVRLAEEHRQAQTKNKEGTPLGRSGRPMTLEQAITAILETPAGQELRNRHREEIRLL